MTAISKILISPSEVWIDELAATVDGSAVARWTLLSACESALESQLTTSRAVVRLQVARPLRARRILVSYAHMACTEHSSVSKKACPPILDRGTSTRRHRASFLCTACLVTS